MKRGRPHGLVTILGGFAMAAALYFVPLGSKGDENPLPPLWPLGLLVAAIGAWDLLLARSPAVADFDRANPRVKWILYVLGVGGVVACWAYFEK